jgi:hypothetical protein
MKLEDVTGKSLLAIKVFGLSIQALTSHMRKLLENENTLMANKLFPVTSSSFMSSVKP